MSNGTIKYALVKSMNALSFAAPYDGEQHATLTLRRHPRRGNDVELSIERGQFVLGVEGGSVNVRFDKGQTQKFRAAPPSDGGTTTIFLEGYSRFVKLARKSKQITIEAEFYQEGAPSLSFDSSGLQW